MRKSPFLLPLILCTVIACIMGAVVAVLYADGDEPAIKPPETSSQNEPPKEIPVTFTTDLSAYESYMNPEDGNNFLILVNKTHKLDKTEDPKDLIAVRDAKKSIELNATAEKALEAMFIEMRAAGFTDVFVTSAYRSYDYQDYLFNYYIEDEMSKGLSYEQAREKVLTYSAEAGTSEHQSGLAVDLMTNGMRELDETFAGHPVYDWLTENAWKFGFILRFPADKTDITGYSYEPWHYRFVGRKHAYAIHQNGLCLEEYVLMKK